MFFQWKDQTREVINDNPIFTICFQVSVRPWKFPYVVVCITVQHWFPTSSAIKHKKKQYLRLIRSFYITYFHSKALGTFVPVSCPFLCVLCMPLPAVYHASLAESFASEFGIAAVLNCRNTVILGRREWLVIDSPEMKLTALGYDPLFDQPPLQFHPITDKFNISCWLLLSKLNGFCYPALEYR